MLEHCGNITSFLTSEVAQMVKSVTKHSDHVVRRAAPLFPEHLLIIVSFCDFYLSVPLSVKPCILLGHYLFLRASNLVSPSMEVWGGPHTLRVKDVTLNHAGLQVRINSSKTRVKPVMLTLAPNENQLLCPVRAWANYVTVVAPAAVGPAFIDSVGRPLTSKFVVACMRQALMHDPSIDANKVSMHSLRRGAAQTAAAAGCTTEQIMVAGSWASSSGLKPYLSI